MLYGIENYSLRLDFFAVFIINFELFNFRSCMQFVLV